MEHRGYPTRAYKLAMLAMKNVHLAYNQVSFDIVITKTDYYYQTARNIYNIRFMFWVMWSAMGAAHLYPFPGREFILKPTTTNF